jgi:probable rRNA maturation factor
MGEGEPGLRVSVSDERGRPLRAAGLAAWLRRAAPRRARGAVSIALVSDRRIRSMNRTYRRRDYATDVLSFPSEERGFLGDIAIAKGVAARQARDAQHSFPTELRVLALHGLLHLIGYDHERDRGDMRRVEERLLRQNGIQSGLIRRGSVAQTRNRHRTRASDPSPGLLERRSVLETRERFTPRARQRVGVGPDANKK